MKKIELKENMLNPDKSNTRIDKNGQKKTGENMPASPLGKEPTTDELEKHWKKHHRWHWESNNEKTPEEALLKNKK